VVLKVPYEKMNGNFFAEFIGKHFNTCFAKCGRKIMILACFSWIITIIKSTAARKAMEKIGAEFHKIPAGSPDLNLIENVFHLVKKSVENEAIANNIT
jgi:hypothetical protein